MDSKLLSLVRHGAQKRLEAETVIDNGRLIWMSYFHFIETLMEFIRSRFRRFDTATWLRIGRSWVRIPERKDFFYLRLCRPALGPTYPPVQNSAAGS